MEVGEWMRRYLAEAQRLGFLSAEACARYKSDCHTARLQKHYPNDPEGAARFLAKFAGKSSR
jgi:hypothetical protein